jgi:hypothetical protein
LWHFIQNPLPRQKYFYNFRIIIPDTAAMLLNVKPVAQYAALLPLLKSPDRSQFFEPDVTCAILPGTHYRGTNIFTILEILFRTLRAFY